MVLSHRMFELGVKLEYLKRQFPEQSSTETRAYIEAIQKEYTAIIMALFSEKAPWELTFLTPIKN